MPRFVLPAFPQQADHAHDGTRSDVGRYGDHAAGHDLRVRHHGKCHAVVAGENREVRTATGPGVFHIFQVAGGFFDGANIWMRFAQNGEVFRQKLSARSPRNDIGDDLNLRKGFCHRSDVFPANLQRTGTVVIGVDQKDRFDSGFDGMLGCSE